MKLPSRDSRVLGTIGIEQRWCKAQAGAMRHGVPLRDRDASAGPSGAPVLCKKKLRPERGE